MSLLSILLHYNTRLILATFVGHQQTTNVLGPTAIIVASMVILKQLATKFMGTPSGPQPTRGSNSNASLKGIAEPHVNAAVAPTASFNNLLANLSKKQY